MSDPEQRKADHKEYHSHKTSSPARTTCDGCDVDHTREVMNKNWKDSGWDICDFCLESVPTFALELIDERNGELDKKDDYIDRLERNRDNFQKYACIVTAIAQKATDDLKEGEAISDLAGIAFDIKVESGHVKNLKKPI